MNNLYKIIVLLLIVSCSTKTEKTKTLKLKSDTDSTYMSNEETETVKIITAKDTMKKDSLVQEYDNETDDCIFDQTTQTDEFLKNIEELKNYEWDYESRTATIILENKDTLLIYRGGCNEFSVSAQFQMINDTTNYASWENVYDKVLWIASVLKNEFDYDSIKKEIDENSIEISKYDHSEVGYFTSDYLSNNNYCIERQLNDEMKIITLSYFIN